MALGIAIGALGMLALIAGFVYLTRPRDKGRAPGFTVYRLCWHSENLVEPVMHDGQRVASLCTACDTQLPASWGCEECHYAPVTQLHSIGTGRVLVRPCSAHGTRPLRSAEE